MFIADLAYRQGKTKKFKQPKYKIKTFTTLNKFYDLISFKANNGSNVQHNAKYVGLNETNTVA